MREERFEIGGGYILEVCPEQMELNLLGPERKIKGAEPGSDEEFAHELLDNAKFKSKENLEKVYDALNTITEITFQEEE